MFWGEDIPRLRLGDAGGPQTELVCVAGAVPGQPATTPLAPPPDSWASQPEADIAIWTLRLDPGARWTLPPAAGAASGTRRCLYFFAGSPVRVGGHLQSDHAALVLDAGAAVELVNEGDKPAEFLLLQGRPIGEPVVQYGPFVMNTEAEVRQAFADYRSTQFGGWPWGDMAPVHGADPGRFARHADGSQERRGPASVAVSD
jgi:redox-sensitive bicupin YhaK (pirin superfamily)